MSSRGTNLFDTIATMDLIIASGTGAGNGSNCTNSSTSSSRSSGTTNSSVIYVPTIFRPSGMDLPESGSGDVLGSLMSTLSINRTRTEPSRNVGGPGPVIIGNEIRSTSEQLGAIWSNVYGHRIQDPFLSTGDDDADEDCYEELDDALETLGSLGAILSPASLEPSEITLSIGANHLRQIKYKREALNLKEVHINTDHLQSLCQEVHSQSECMAKILENYLTEMEGCSLDEMATIRRSYEVEIEAEEPIYAKLLRSEPIYNGQKIQESMTTIKNLHEKLEALKNEVLYSSEIPPNLENARGVIIARKRELQSILDDISQRTDGLTNF